MKKFQKLLCILLFIVGCLALCLGCAEVIRRINDTHQTTQTGTEHQGVSESTDSGLQTPPQSTGGSNLSVSTEPGAAAPSGTPEVSPEATPLSTPEPTPEPTPSPTPEPTPTPYVSPYQDYFTKYPDMVAWFQIPGMNVDYPVMWTPGDETYYLYRHYDGSDNINGSLLLDTDSSLDPLTTNLIIHGHNMKSGAMFGNIPKYADKDFYEQHKEMLLYTADGERTYEIVAVFRSQVYKKTDTVFKFYKFFQADTEEEFNDFYDNIKALSLYDTGVTAEFGDHFITLSTCVSHVENGRFVVVAKEVTASENE